MGNYIWGDMNRATNDPTGIDEAISTAITAHDDDPEAHLGADQSLQSHRASEIIDHLAESVVNDKLAKATRRYMAIVDPDSESDFDTIAEAVDYCASNGYGDIYIVAGTHYIDAELSIDARISVYGAGQEETIISSNTGEFSYIYFTDTGPASSTYFAGQTISGITFGTSGNGIGFFGLSREAGIVFEDCYFKHMGEEMNFTWNSPEYAKYFYRCAFSVRSTTGLFYGNYCNFYDCFFDVSGLPDPFINGYHNQFTKCQFYQSSLANSYAFIGTVSGSIRVFQCYFGGCKFDTSSWSQSPSTGIQVIEQCHFQFFSSGRVRLSNRNIRFAFNRVEHSAGQSVLIVSGTVNACVIGNVTTQAVSDSGTTSYLAGNTLV